MDHPDEKPPSAPSVEPIAYGGRLAKQQARMRLWQAQAQRAAKATPGKVGHPKRRIPSMPTLPWNEPK